MVLHIFRACYILIILMFWLDEVKVFAGVTLTVSPSNTVAVNQTVTLQCVFSEITIPVIVVNFKTNKNKICQLEPFNGTCKNHLNCITTNVFCPNKTMYSIQFTVPRTWNEESLYCDLELTELRSNSINFIVEVPVTSVNISSISTTVNVGEQMRLKCATSYCNPPATIMWYKASTNISNQSTYNKTKSDGLFRTESFLQSTVSKTDNGAQVYCKATNIPTKSVTSIPQTVIVLFPPEVTSETQNPYRVTEGDTVILNCSLVTANPKTITWMWFQTDNPSVPLHNGSTYTIPDIGRNSSASYSCTASNSVGTSGKIDIFVEVLYKPEVRSNTKSPYEVTEGVTAKLECTLIVANPKNIIWRWLNSSGYELHNGSSYTIHNVKRSKTGLYTCTATNEVGQSEPIIINMDVQYTPEIKSITRSPYRVIEGSTASMECTFTDANPETDIKWRWSKRDVPNNVAYEAIYMINVVNRSMSGFYKCVAENSIGTSNEVLIDLVVMYKPEIVKKPSTKVNESEKVILTQEIVSNPLSNVSWYNGIQLLKTEMFVENATLIIKEAMCTNTTNFTLVVSNEVERNVTGLVELIVNCKPRSSSSNITLGVTDTSEVEFTITVIAYPEPFFELHYENGTVNDQMMSFVRRNAVYNFTIFYNQTAVKESDYGTYHLRFRNIFGEAVIFVNVISQRKPYKPEITKIGCDATSAWIYWISAFNGGASQSFTVIILNGQQQERESDQVQDKGENEIHSLFVENLQSSTTYMFYVSAQNRHGLTKSENRSCTTLEDESSSNLATISGVAAGGGLFVVIVGIAIVYFRKKLIYEKSAKHIERINNDNENGDSDDDGMRDNILYVSADPVVNEKPETAVYSAVNKASESNNNANVYAEVNKDRRITAEEGTLYADVKPKKGLFKKDVRRKTDENPKKRKGKKRKSKQDVADVYENSEDIAMSSKSDNVYSNTRQKVQNKEERGYKNKDGLLYVEVQFDTKTEKGNQTIHGEDEKTDYATVEFPMAASTHDESGNEKL